MKTGIVKFYNIKNKFGFIIDDETKGEYYVELKHIINPPLMQGDKVIFELKDAKRGNQCVDVKKITTE